MNRSRTIWSMALILMLLLAGCSTPPAPETTNAVVSPAVTSAAVQNPSGQYPGPNQAGTGQGNTGYPAPQNASNSNYPAPGAAIPGYLNATNAPYPLPPTPTLNPGTPVKVVPFRINKPVPDGATQVSGTGPADIPITLADITMYGDILGQTTVKSDGTFVFNLSTPIGKGHLIGIALSDLQGTKWVAANFTDPGFNGDTPKSVPLVGSFFDTVEVGQ
jgi:hypothetical protein